VLLACALFASRSARADARTEARSHFRKGMESISNGRYEEGIADLQRAYEILPHPNVVFNIARAYAESGDLEDAVVFYKKYLEGNPPDRADVQLVVQSLEARIRRQQAALQAARETVGPTAPTAPTTTPGTEAGNEQPPPVAPVVAPLPKPTDAELGQARTEDVFAETVVTASRGAQSPLDASSSTSIITEQDIRLSGISKIPELLRRLAGVDVAETTGSQTEVSIRGFNQRLSNKILVLVNGRSVYVDLLGATLWQSLSIGVEDIDRIEVVRGPGSALYGADAFNGVINIITKQPGEGTSGINAGYGSNDTTHASLWATGRREDFAWRASAGFDNLPRWSREVPPNRKDLHVFTPDQDLSSRTTRLDLRGTHRIGKDVTVGLGGGLTQGKLELLGIGPLNDVDLENFTSSDITAFVDSKHVQARVFWNRFRTNFGVNAAQVGQSLLPGRADQNVIDGELQYLAKFETGKSVAHDLHVGVGYRMKEVQWTYLDRQRYEHHEAFFVHDEIKFGKYFAFVGDYRLDIVPYLERAVSSPKGALLFHPSKQSTLRASVATAFRTPTFLESYLSIPVQLPLAGAALDSNASRPDQGAFKVNPERIFAAELGYLNQDSDFITLDTALFFNHASDLIILADNRAITVGDVSRGLANPDPVTGLYPAFFGGFDNQCQSYNVYGSEIGVRTFPLEGLDFYANYSLSLLKQDDSACTAVQRAANVKDERTSTHKLNAGVQLRTKAGIDGSIDFHYVSPQTWAEQIVDIEQQRIRSEAFHLNAYSLLNARLGYRFLKNQAEVSVMAFNLLGSEHREHPFGQKLGRRAMAYLTYRF
jgi:iron complex outermembrane receptor protein